MVDSEESLEEQLGITPHYDIDEGLDDMLIWLPTASKAMLQPWGKRGFDARLPCPGLLCTQ